MDLERVRDEMKHAFAKDLADGTIDIESQGDSVALNGGNWFLTAQRDGIVGLDLPTNDANYYDEDTNAFLDNVLNVEVEESLAVLDRALGGAIVNGLRRSGASWSETLAGRIDQVRG